MEKEIAHHMAYEAFRISSRLDTLRMVLKEHCGEREYEEFSKVLIRMMTDMHGHLMHPVFRKYPDIQEEMDHKINKYGLLLL